MPYNLSKMNFEITEEQKQFLEQVEDVCKSIRDYEEQCYLEEKFNDRVVPSLGKLVCLDVQSLKEIMTYR